MKYLRNLLYVMLGLSLDICIFVNVMKSCMIWRLLKWLSNIQVDLPCSLPASLELANQCLWSIFCVDFKLIKVFFDKSFAFEVKHGRYHYFHATVVVQDDHITTTQFICSKSNVSDIVLLSCCGRYSRTSAITISC